MSEKKLYHVIAVANVKFYGETPEDVKFKFMSQAETLEEEDWTFIMVEEVESS